MGSRLQAEIKQGKPFAALEGEAVVGLLRTAALLDHALHEALKPHALTLAQYNVLRILRGAGRAGLCGRDVGERLIARVPDVPRLLDRMEELGVLTRERDVADRRHVTARITPAGLRLLDDVAPVIAEVERRWMGRLDADELRAFLAALDTIRAAG